MKINEEVHEKTATVSKEKNIDNEIKSISKEDGLIKINSNYFEENTEYADETMTKDLISVHKDAPMKNDEVQEGPSNYFI